MGSDGYALAVNRSKGRLPRCVEPMLKPCCSRQVGESAELGSGRPWGTGQIERHACGCGA
mgnify:CR=1 FL=1